MAWSSRGEKIVTLLSNDSLDVYPDNKIGRFRSQLDLLLDPDTKWEAALHSCSYVRSWNNFSSRDLYYMVYWCRETNERSQLVIPPGHYDQESFVRRCVPPPTGDGREHKEVVIRWDPNVYKFVVQFDRRFAAAEEDNELVPDDDDDDDDEGTEGEEKPSSGQGRRLKAGRGLYDVVLMSPAFAQKLGFGNGKEGVSLYWNNGQSSQRYWSSLPVQFDAIDSFLLQTSFVHSTHHIGRGMYPVLAVVPAAGEWGVRQTYTPQQRLYFDVNLGQVDFPETLLTTLSGDIVPFSFGVSAVTLVVREKNPDNAT